MVMIMEHTVIKVLIAISTWQQVPSSSGQALSCCTTFIQALDVWESKERLPW
jgi:hypothetical protein